MRDLLDRQLGRVTIYRLVTVVLALLYVIYVGLSAVGVIDGFSVVDAVLTLVVVVVATVASGWGLALVWRIRPHTESSVITALLLFFLFGPLSSGADLAWLALGGVLASLSKYVLAWRGRHVFNPAAAGAFLLVVVQRLADREFAINALWLSIGSKEMIAFVVVGAAIVLWRTRRLDLGAVFIGLAIVLVVVGATLGQFETPFVDAVKTAFWSTPIVFLAGFMLSEPLTLPPRRAQQLTVAAVTAVVYAYPIWIGVFTSNPPDLGVFTITPELALLIGNLAAFALSRRRGLALVLEERRQLTPETHELVFRPTRDVTFVPGQYAELTVPHAKPDGRGSRRSFSISSPPAPDGRIAFALRVPEKSSTFKRALVALEPGATVHATGVGGDFVLPTDRRVPVVLVAGGIGITPFLSQLRHEPGRDAVVVYGAPAGTEVPFVGELAEVKVVLVSPSRPDIVPPGWTYVAAPLLTVDIIAAAVPDLEKRRAYVSGPPAMVNAVRTGLSKLCRGVRTDYFTGY